MTAVTGLAVEPREEALWVLERLSPGSAANHLSVTFTVATRLDARLLNRALLAVVSRYEALRTCYQADGAQLSKRVARPSEIAELSLVSELPLAGRDLQAVLRQWVRRPFELSGGLLLRAGLVVEAERSVVCVAVHHLIFDTISAVPFLHDLAACYDAFAAGRQPDPELLAERPQLPQPEPSAASMDYWLAELAGYDPAAVRLACELPEPASPSLSGEVVLQELPAADRQLLRDLQRQLRAPESTVLLTAFWLLLNGHGGGSDIAIGNPVSTRPTDAPDAVGYHVNVLPLRIRAAAEDTVASLTRRVREQFFEGMAHLDVPVDMLTPLIARDDTSWRSMLVNHVFNYVNEDVLPTCSLAGRTTEPMHVENGCSKFNLELFVISAGGQLRLRLVYNTDVLSRDDAQRLLGRYRAVLHAMGRCAEQPVAEFDVWSEQDHRTIDAANATERPIPAASLLDQIAEQVALRPDAPALAEATGPTSYARLWDRAGELAGLFQANGVRPGDVVALCLPRGSELAAAVLASWRLRASYLPIDPGLPADRIGYQLDDAGARVVLAAEPDARLEGHGVPVLLGSSASEPSESEPSVAADEMAGAEPAAYLIYTSGSTGRPKGTRIGQRALRNLVEHFRLELGMAAAERMLWSTSFAFDISVLELMVPLVSGATVVVAEDAVRADPAAMRSALEAGVRYVQATPTTWRLVLDGVRELLGNLVVLVGGEPLPLATGRQLAAAAEQVHHVYGPTETTVWSSSEVLRPGLPEVLVGRPIANTTFAVLDSHGRELPVGARGELWIGGAGVAEHYHRRPELTAERFTVRNGRRGYRTGDVARWTEDGRIQLFGRSDRQVKIRGNRIELGEIENVLAEHAAVRSAAVVVVEQHAGDAQLIGFVENPTGEGSLDEVWEFANSRLPHGFLPQQLVSLDRLPVNMSNKVDYPELTRRAQQLAKQAGSAAPSVAGDGRLTDALVALWTELLQVDGEVDEHTHFFRSGGHSVLGAVLVQRIKAELGASVPLAELFEAPTPATLAARIGELADSADEGSA